MGRSNNILFKYDEPPHNLTSLQTNYASDYSNMLVIQYKSSNTRVVNIYMEDSIAIIILLFYSDQGEVTTVKVSLAEKNVQ